jgi:hypothetical protein
MEVATIMPGYFLLSHRRSNCGRHYDQTTRESWDTLVAQAREVIANVAQHAINCIQDPTADSAPVDRFPIHDLSVVGA